MGEQLAMFPRYRANGKDYETVQDAARALGRVTLDRAHAPHPKPGATVMPAYVQMAAELERGTYTRPTLFKEITAVCPESSALWKRGPGEQTISIDALAAVALDALRRAMRRMWNSDDVCVMPHSSGYDSRLILSLARECGAQNLYTMTWQPEIDSARALLDFMDWPEQQRIYIGAGIADYQAPALDFAGLGAYQSEAERFIVGPRLASMQVRPDTVATLTASFADETLAFNTARWPSVSYFHAARLLDGPRPWTSAIWHMPFVSTEWLEVMTTYRIEGGGDQLKRAMLRQLNPALAEYPNQRFALAEEIAKNGRHAYTELRPATRDACMRSYEQSWYAATTGRTINPPPWGTHDDGVRHYITAAICEHCRTEGVDVV